MIVAGDGAIKCSDKKKDIYIYIYIMYFKKKCAKHFLYVYKIKRD